MKNLFFENLWGNNFWKFETKIRIKRVVTTNYRLFGRLNSDIWQHYAGFGSK